MAYSTTFDAGNQSLKSQKQSFADVLQNKFSEKFRKFHIKTTVLESLFQACNFIKKRLQHRCFPVKFVKFTKTPFLQNNSSGCFWIATSSFPCNLIITKIMSAYKNDGLLHKEYYRSYVKVFERSHFSKINGYLAPYFSDFQIYFRRNHCKKNLLTKIREM